jgi:hypothetical protein
MTSDGRSRGPRRSGTRRVGKDCWEPLGIDSTNNEDQAAVISLIKEAYAPILNSYLAEGEGKDAKNLFKSHHRYKQFKEGCIAGLKQLPRHVKSYVPKKEDLVKLLYDILRRFRHTDAAWLQHIHVPSTLRAPVPAPRRSSRVSGAKKSATVEQRKETTTKNMKSSPVVTSQAPKPVQEPEPILPARIYSNVQPEAGLEPHLQPPAEPAASCYSLIKSEQQAQANSLEQELTGPPRLPRPIKGTPEWDTEYRKRLIPLRFYNRGSDYDLLDQDWVMDSDPNDENYGLRDPAMGSVLNQPKKPRLAKHLWEKHL